MAQREDVQSPPAGPGTVPPTPTPRRNHLKASGAVVGLCCSVFIFVAACALVLVSVQLAAMRRNGTAHRERPFCCPREAAKLFAVIDNKAAPCEDFFAYVCRNAIDQGFARERAAHDILWNIDADIIAGTSNYGVKAAVGLHTFYTSCVTEIWQPELRLRGALGAVFEIANATKPMSHAQLLRFALEVQKRYNLNFFFMIFSGGNDVYIQRNLLRVAVYGPFCDDACYATVLSAVNEHIGANCTSEQITAWEQLFRDEFSAPDLTTWDEIRTAFGDIEAEQFKAILLEFQIDIDATESVIADSKARLFADIERLWNVNNQPLSLCHVLVVIVLGAIQLLVHDDATLKSPTMRSTEVCQFHLHKCLHMWRITNVAALTSPDKDRQLRSMFEATRRSLAGYEPLRRLVAAGNDTANFESLVRNMSLMLPSDLVLPEMGVPVLNKSGFVRNIFRLWSFQYDTEIEKRRRGLPVFFDDSPESTRERMLFLDQRTLYVTAPAYAWLSDGTNNPLLADAPVIASRMAALMWWKVDRWDGWSRNTRNALSSFRECVKKSEDLLEYRTEDDLFVMTMGLRIAAIVGTASSTAGDIARAHWFRMKKAWSLYRMSEAQFFYARYAYFRCSRDNPQGSVNGPTMHNADFATAFQCQPRSKVGNESDCADVAVTRGATDDDLGNSAATYLVNPL
ncbi:hypothetical protein HPB49_020312 [Dermacentor silvarum]|uniref:Uncharacterized protein n=1 Tax=Dermacentor silvarum TaxID=543639 RepID=A0ACB8C588_DERSI|nr:hypothetical protein HPB49_020312 [Dermacentor silvarum]